MLHCTANVKPLFGVPGTGRIAAQGVKDQLADSYRWVGTAAPFPIKLLGSGLRDATSRRRDATGTVYLTLQDSGGPTAPNKTHGIGV